MNNNLLFAVYQYLNAKKMLAGYEKKIMDVICDELRDIIPDIKARYDYCHSEVMVFYSEARAKAFENDREEVSGNNWRLYSVIESVFPELGFSIRDNYLYLSDEERAEIMKRLKKYKGSMEGEKK